MAKSTDTPNGWYPGARRVNTPNFTRGRTGQLVLAAVQHVTDGPEEREFESCISWFQNPNAGASSTFLFGKKGEVVQFVSIYDTAWANGLQWVLAPRAGIQWAGIGWYNARGKKVSPTWPLLKPPTNPNKTTASMEHAGQPNEPWTEPMFQATVDVLRWLGPECKIASWEHGRTLIAHADLDTVDKRNCPGPHVQWDRLARAANTTPSPSPPLTLRYRLKTDQAVFTDRRPDAPLAQGPDDGMTIRRKDEIITVGDISNGWLWDATGIGFLPVAVAERVT